MTLLPDSQQLDRFIKCLFRYADPDTYVSLRAFHQTDRAAVPFARAIAINGDLSKLTTAAARAIIDAGDGIVFAPPICTFTNPDRARSSDLANGLVLSVEIDDGDTSAARIRLESLLGPATVVVLSGGDWPDPVTGEVHPKRHIHWRLSEPTRGQSDHDKLRQARDLAARLVGADPTGKPVVHPLRWAGSWNVKTTPRLARIEAEHGDAEINLDDALERLEEAVEAAGLASVDLPASGNPEAPLAAVASAMAAIPNGGDTHYDTWIRLGYAAWRATGGNGFSIWDEWSRKSEKNEVAERNIDAWNRIGRAINGSSAPRTIGAGTIFFHAQASGWRRPDDEPPAWFDEAPPWESVDTEAEQATNPPAADAPELPPFPATGITLDEWTNIPPRERVYGHFLYRKFISALGAPGGAGKTAYATVIAFCVALDRPLLRERVHQSGSVWLYNLEDPRAELLRRLKAVAICYNIPFEAIQDRIYLDSGRDRPLVIATTLRDGSVVAWPQVPSLIAEIKARSIRLLIVDPFVRSHRVEENVNDQIDFVAALWAQVAEKADCCVLLVHHFKKGGMSGDAAAFRGASALIDASRAAVTLTTMSAEEAQRLGVEEKERWQYTRVDSAKLNLAPPPEHAVWLHLDGISLENATADMEADNVQAVTRWEPPSAFEGFSISAVVRVLERLKNGPGGEEQFYLTGGTKGRWAGLVIMAEAGKTEEQAKRIIGIWKRAGLIRPTTYHSPTESKQRAGMEVDEAMFQELRRSDCADFPE